MNPNPLFPSMSSERENFKLRHSITLLAYMTTLLSLEYRVVVQARRLTWGSRFKPLHFIRGNGLASSMVWEWHVLRSFDTQVYSCANHLLCIFRSGDWAWSPPPAPSSPTSRHPMTSPAIFWDSPRPSIKEASPSSRSSWRPLKGRGAVGVLGSLEGLGLNWSSRSWLWKSVRAALGLGSN